MAGAALKPLGLQAEPDFADIQGLVRFAHARLSEACFLLLRIVDRRAAGAWLAAAPVTTADVPSISISAPGLEFFVGAFAPNAAEDKTEARASVERLPKSNAGASA